MNPPLKHWGRHAVLAALWVYRKGISPFTPRCCRFQPTCSAYASQAISRFGLLRGTWLTVRRLLRCHPFYRGPLHDPVPRSKEGSAPPGELECFQEPR